MGVLDCAGLSDIGCRRASNQDRWGVDTEQGLFIVADGVAGSSDGALAAELVVKLLPSYLARHLTTDRVGDPDAPERLCNAAAELSDDLYLKGQADPLIAGATSTLVAVMIAGSRALLTHLGDSRAYLHRDGELHRLTRDHSLVQALIDAEQITDEEAKTHPGRNVVIRYAAMPPPAQPDVAAVDLQDGDRFLLSTDGLHGVVAEANIAELLVAHHDPAEACAALIEAARNAGGPDNITAVVIDASAS